ncbi:MAG: hypothetical protein NTV29_03630 [Planctomycetota bacterium]|nr:hypothetical protein [Planctomycetota bacterium]
MTNTREHKLAWWIDHRLNVLFRGRSRDEIASIVKAALDHAGLKWHASPPTVSVEQILADGSIEAIFFDDIDRMPKRIRDDVLDLLRSKREDFPNLKVIWAAVSLTDDEDEFDLETSDPAHAEHFDITVDVRSSTS